AIAGDRVSRGVKARVGLHVDMQQISGTEPLIAICCLSRCAWTSRLPMTMQDLPHRRVRMAGDSCDQPRTPARLATDLAYALLLAAGQQPRTATRTTAAVSCPRQ